MDKRRMLILADWLACVPEEKFDMGVYARADEAVTNAPVCASRACRLGWATSVPEFHVAGLHLRVSPFNNQHGEVMYIERGTRYIDARAAEKFFDLTPGQAHALVGRGPCTAKASAVFVRNMANHPDNTSRWFDGIAKED